MVISKVKPKCYLRFGNIEIKQVKINIYLVTEIRWRIGIEKYIFQKLTKVLRGRKPSLEKKEKKKEY